MTDKESLFRADPERIEGHIDRMSRFTSTPGSGCTRMSFSEEERLARAYLQEFFDRIPLSVTVDPVGNLRARMEGLDPELPPVLTGSHLDSVFFGGDYDGVVGVVCALEALTLIAESGRQPRRSIELIIFVEEEGPNFGSPLTGSKALTGIYTGETLKKLINSQGVSFYQAAESAGLKPERMHEAVLRRGDVEAMIEVHVEQSLVLDKEGISLGVVSGIAGMCWIEVQLKGEANHAGATPMAYRSDPLAGAAELISAVEQAALDSSSPYTVATVGKIECSPNAPNIIPDSVRLTIDLRDQDSTGIRHVRDVVDGMLKDLEERRGLTCSQNVTGEIAPTACSPRLVSALGNAAESYGYPFKQMMSGALHDTAVMAELTEIGMLFIPSIGGRSHVPEERTEIADIVKAAAVLTEALWRLCGE